MTSPFSEEEFEESLYKKSLIPCMKPFRRTTRNKIERNAVLAYPVIKDVFENEGDQIRTNCSAIY